MPDLATHIALGLGVGAVINNRRIIPPLLLGTVLPDVCSRIPSILYDKVYWYAEACHTPFVMLLWCYLLSLFFKTGVRKTMFLWMYVGVIIHLVPDALQRHVAHGYFWFFPFSWYDPHGGFFWSEDSMVFVPFLAVAAVIFLITQKSARR
ncbi:MAG: metal-dependent hydrolase [Chitinivibrionales bacterium]|nr:metal-dependent hydrolase [Chitinivibrionales bacterium]